MMAKDIRKCAKGVGGVSLALVLVGCLSGVILMADADEERAGGAAAERFGFIVRSVGDLNADGHSDFVVTAPNPGHDKTYIHFGPQTPEPFGDDTPPRLVFEGPDNSEAGWSVASGFLSGQGRELVVGAPAELGSKGAVYLLQVAPPKEAPIFGETIIGPQNAYAQFRGETINNEGHYAGWSVEVGDLNDDGHDDLIIGACRREGTVYVVHGPIASGVHNLGNAADTVLKGRDSEGLFGCSLSVGDLNGDGRDDLVVGGFRERLDPLGVGGYGRVHVFYDVPAGEFSSEELGNKAVLVGTRGSSLGYALDAGGDLNGDGVDDLAMGASAYTCHRVHDNNPLETCVENPLPKVYVLLGGKNGDALVGEHNVTDKADSTISGAAKNTGFGHAVSIGGDINGDGRDDLVIGTQDQSLAYLFYGMPNPSAQLAYSSAQGTFDGTAQGLLAGFSVDIAPDLNGDGLADVLIGAPAQEWFGRDVGQDAGRAYVFYGQE